MMRKIAFALTVLVSIVLPGTVSRATILEVACSYGPRPVPSEHWSFDYDSQVLTLTSKLRRGDIGGFCFPQQKLNNSN